MLQQDLDPPTHFEQDLDSPYVLGAGSRPPKMCSGQDLDPSAPMPGALCGALLGTAPLTPSCAGTPPFTSFFSYNIPPPPPPNKTGAHHGSATPASLCPLIRRCCAWGPPTSPVREWGPHSLGWGRGSGPMTWPPQGSPVVGQTPPAVPRAGGQPMAKVTPSPVPTYLGSPLT